MSRVSVESARRFVAQATLPPTRRAKPRRSLRGAGSVPRASVDVGFDATKNQSAVVGSEVVSFMTGVSAERRASIVNSSLLAQLVARAKVKDEKRIEAWYDAYFDVLTNIGWAVQAKTFDEYHEKSQNFQAHKAILAVATALLGAGATALVLVETTLKALQSMDENNPWITIFNRESRAARTAHFQISLAEQNPAGQVFVSLMAFVMEAESTITQVLFFKAKANEVTLRHYSGRLMINTGVLDGVSDAIEAKLLGVASDYVKALPEIDIRGTRAARNGRRLQRLPAPPRPGAKKRNAPTRSSVRRRS